MHDLLKGKVRVNDINLDCTSTMSETGYVELPVIQWLSGQGSATPGDAGLGWTYRDEAAMAEFDRPLEDALVEKVLVDAIQRINSEVTTEAQARMAISALRKAMSHPDRLTANRETLDLLRDGVTHNLVPGQDAKAARQNNLFVYDLGTRVSFHSPWNLSRLIAKLSIC